MISSPCICHIMVSLFVAIFMGHENSEEKTNQEIVHARMLVEIHPWRPFSRPILLSLTFHLSCVDWRLFSITASTK